MKEKARIFGRHVGNPKDNFTKFYKKNLFVTKNSKAREYVDNSLKWHNLSIPFAI